MVKMLIHAELAINQLTVLSSLRSQISTRHVERSINSSANARSRNGAHLSLDTQLHFTHSSAYERLKADAEHAKSKSSGSWEGDVGSNSGGDGDGADGWWQWGKGRRLWRGGGGLGVFIALVEVVQNGDINECVVMSPVRSQRALFILLTARGKRTRGEGTSSSIRQQLITRESAWKFECLSEASIELTIVDTNRPVRKVGVRHPRHVFVSMFHCRHGAASGILLVDLSSRNERKVEFRNAMIGVPYDYTLSIHSLSDFIKDIEAELARLSRESKREKKRVVLAG
ncbi:hypothetical protein HZH68_001467 [Vespula germanica]|uniref:Uncharacterized protein n=1 Tax=Vespula germanica TaxID=30212 RepID=A0A834NVN6_VESGE|nr:hypothetical protein HZH68_001467 [Vespula germanica]